MKRVKAACICQTVHFTTTAKVSPQEAARLVQKEYEDYKINLRRTYTKYKILQELPQEDGSLIIEIRKEQNTTPTGDYLN